MTAGARGGAARGLLTAVGASTAPWARIITVPQVIEDAEPQGTLTTLATVVDETADPIARLEGLAMLGSRLDATTMDTVAAARADGRSWAQVGRALAITRQAAQQRFGRPPSTGSPVEPVPEPQRRPRRRQRAPRELTITTPGRRALLRVVVADLPPLGRDTDDRRARG